MKWRIWYFLVLFLLVVSTITTLLLGSWLNTSSQQVKVYKTDFFTVNQLKYGFLSGANWSTQVEKIIEQKIDSFSFSTENKQVLIEQVSGVMARLIDQVDTLMHERQDKLKDRVKMSAIRMFVDLDKVRAKIPRFASVVVAEIEKSSNKDKVRNLVKNKINELLIDQKKPLVSEQQETIKKYNTPDLRTFNLIVHQKIEKIEVQQRIWGYMLVGIMGFVLLIWVLILKLRIKQVYALAFLFSVLISFVNLYTGINLPMLEIDARISELDLEVLSSHITFFDQVLFYQSKSIWEVAFVLISKGKFAAILVGVLILIFSVLFPVAKLIAASICLFYKEKSNSFIKLLAFKSGKWSMTDVMVVAIFIAYIGFQSIIDEQLTRINESAGRQDMANLLTTNRSNLQIGFIVFLAFVIFNLILAVILKRITYAQSSRLRVLHWWKNRRETEKKSTS